MADVVVKFAIDTPVGPYSDALTFTPAEFAALSADDVERMKYQRASNWLEPLSDFLDQVMEFSFDSVAEAAQVAEIEAKAKPVKDTIPIAAAQLDGAK